jgi:hypothetical protein
MRILLLAIINTLILIFIRNIFIVESLKQINTSDFDIIVSKKKKTISISVAQADHAQVEVKFYNTVTNNTLSPINQQKCRLNRVIMPITPGGSKFLLQFLHLALILALPCSQ